MINSLVFLTGVHHSKKMMVHGKATMMEKLSITSHKESWMTAMDSDRKPVTSEGKT